MTLPRGDMGLSAICDCGISRSYSLFLKEMIYYMCNHSGFQSLAIYTFYVQATLVLVRWHKCQLCLSLSLYITHWLIQLDYQYNKASQCHNYTPQTWEAQVWRNTNFVCKIVNIFLPISFNICFWCSKEQSR